MFLALCSPNIAHDTIPTENKRPIFFVFLSFFISFLIFFAAYFTIKNTQRPFSEKSEERSAVFYEIIFLRKAFLFTKFKRKRAF